MSSLCDVEEQVEPSPATIPETCTTWHPKILLDKHIKINTAAEQTSQECEQMGILTILIPCLSCHDVLHESPHEEGVKPPWRSLPQDDRSCGILYDNNRSVI